MRYFISNLRRVLSIKSHEGARTVVFAEFYNFDDLLEDSGDSDFDYYYFKDFNMFEII